MSLKAFSSETLDVSLGKASRRTSGLVSRTLDMTESRDSERRARRATARLPCEGWERMRAIPVPYNRNVRSVRSRR